MNCPQTKKMELMEKLWADLSTSADYKTPEWHGKELAKRKNAVKEGKITYTDWDKAKEEIRKEIS
ncbi:MAG: addiction module protein [Balneolaceae bacterium]